MKKRKMNKNDDNISASEGNNLVSKDKALQHFCKYNPAAKNQMQ